MSKIGLIIEREFLERVRKKTFIVVTILTPLLLLASMFAPVFFMSLSNTSAKTESVKVAVDKKIMNDANIQVDIQTLQNAQYEQQNKQKELSNAVPGGVGFALAMIIYFIVIVYGQQVLQSVIDEKQSRVLDVMITSCKPFDLMMGKILGIALVAALQILIWIVLIIVVSKIAVPIIAGKIGIDLAVIQAAGASGIAGLLSSITNLSLLSKIFFIMLIYIIGGFLFYASMYAAIGSSVDTPQDAAQFNIIIMLPVVIGISVLMGVMQNPNSNMAYWCSLIPFTSPIVMMARIPFGIPTSEIVVSIVVLYISFMLVTWVAARIFRVGVFMHGKKPTWKDLGSWIKMK